MNALTISLFCSSVIPPWGLGGAEADGGTDPEAVGATGLDCVPVPLDVGAGAVEVDAEVSIGGGIESAILGRLFYVERPSGGVDG